MRRFWLLCAVIVGLAPGTCTRWVKMPDPTDYRQILSLTPVETPVRRIGDFEVAGIWRMRSPNAHFGSYSGLITLPGGRLFAASDNGRLLIFVPPGRPARAPRLDVFGPEAVKEKQIADIEAVTRDPVSGKVWAAFEQRNMVMRHNAQFRREASIHPKAMRDWLSNTGAESIVRLADGRFIILSEGNPRWSEGDLPALLFPFDPVEGARPVSFRFRPPAGYRPADAALLPDGRVMILLRTVRWGLPPTFAAKLMVADPAAIRPGARWHGQVVADIAAPLPTDNYEGLAIEPGAGGSAVLWLISDDNGAKFQRTLLLELIWRPNEKARGPGRALR